MENANKDFKPYIAAENGSVKEFTVRAVVLGAIFGILFGAATVYMTLKAGLSVSASIPIAVLAISVGRRFLGTSILENNIIQTAGSAGESVAAGVVFTLPGFLFLTDQAVGTQYFSYSTILILAMFGGILGTLMMIPLRKSLIVKEHGNLPYPEGTACASVLIAGERGGDFAKMAYWGLGAAVVYAFFQKIFKLVTETAAWATAQTTKAFPSATVAGDITPEYLGVGYIIGPRIAGVLVAGGVLAWLGLIPLLSSLVPAETVALQLQKLGYLKDMAVAGGKGGWDPILKNFTDWPTAIYFAYVRQIGAGAVAAGGFMTLLKTLPTIVSSFQSSMKSIRERGEGASKIARTDDDLNLKTVGLGVLGLIAMLVVLPQIPGDSVVTKLLIGILIVVFGFFFVTVASRIVGIIGSSSSPISGMTIATLMATALIFIAFRMTGSLYEPMALVVGSMICIAAANAGATSQDLKTGYLVGATPRYQQLALFVGVIVSSLAIGWTLKILDTPTPELAAQGIQHAIGTTYPAPQANLMATLIKGLLGGGLDWNFVLIGCFLAITIELCGVNALSFAVGAYLPLSTTLPIWIGGTIRGISDKISAKNGENEVEEDLRPGNLFATGLVAGGALMGVFAAIAQVFAPDFMARLNFEESWRHLLGAGGFNFFGVAAFAVLCGLLFWVSRRKH